MIAILEAAVLLLKEDEKGPDITTVLLIVGAMVGTVFLLRLTQKRRARDRINEAEISRSMEGQPPNAPFRARGQSDPEISKLYIELNEFARDLEGRMDTKLTYLRRLIVDAERVSADLNRTIQRAEALQRGEQMPASVPAPEESGVPDPSPSITETGTGAVTEAEKTPSLMEVTVDGSSTAEQEEPAGDGMQNRILSLAKEGRAPEAIAEEVGIPKGEVELVLSLHRAKKRKTSRPKGR